MLRFDQTYVEVRQVARAIIQAATGEAYDDIREALLWLNVEATIAPAGGDLLAYLFNCVTTHSTITHDFPLLQECSFGIEIDVYMRKAAQFWGIERMQAMYYDDIGRVDFLRGSKGACFVVVNRFH